MGNNATAISSRFRDTPLGSLPEEWGTIELGDLFEEVDVRVKDLPPQEHQNVRVLSMTRYQGLILQSQKFGRRVASRDTSNYKVVKFGQLVVGFPIDEGVIAILWRYQSGVVSPAYRVWKLKREVDYLFLDWLLRTPQLIAVYRQLSSRTVHRRRSLSKSDFKRVVVPLPPLPEQRRIAHVLSTIQRAIAAQDDLITAAREVKRSLMQRLFTYGPGAEPAPTKETEIGEMPEDWEVVEVGKTGEVITGTTPSTKVPEYYNGSYMFISPGDIGETKYAKQAVKYLSEEGLVVSRALPKDTVLVVCIGATIGKTAVTFADQSATNQQINAIIPNERVFSHYLYYALSYRSPSLPSLASGAAVPIVNKSNFSKFLVAIPPLPEQETIAQTLSAADSKIEAEEQRKAALGALFKSMLHQLMTGQVRVPELVEVLQ